MLEHGASLLINVMLARVHRLMSRHAGRPSGCHVQMLIPLSVHTEIGVHQPDIFGRGLHHHAGSTVAEDRACIAILIVGHAGHVIATTHDDALITTTAKETSAGLHCIQEACTGSLHIEAKSILQAKTTDD